jgi:hypothetical protein
MGLAPFLFHPALDCSQSLVLHKIFF